MIERQITWPEMIAVVDHPEKRFKATAAASITTGLSTVAEFA